MAKQPKIPAKAMRQQAHQLLMSPTQKKSQRPADAVPRKKWHRKRAKKVQRRPAKRAPLLRRRLPSRNGVQPGVKQRPSLPRLTQQLKRRKLVPKTQRRSKSLSVVGARQKRKRKRLAKQPRQQKSLKNGQHAEKRQSLRQPKQRQKNSAQRQ